MKKICYIFLVPLIFIGCGTTQKTISYLSYNSQNNSDNIFKFNKIQDSLIYFTFKIKNNNNYNQHIALSKIFIAFHNQLNDSTITDSLKFNTIIPEVRINYLKNCFFETSLQKNPYSLSNKTMKDLIVEGLIKGIFGMSQEEIEEQRKKNEDNWEEEHSEYISKLKDEIFSWTMYSFRDTTLLANKEIEGFVAFKNKPNYPFATIINGNLNKSTLKFVKYEN